MSVETTDGGEMMRIMIEGASMDGDREPGHCPLLEGTLTTTMEEVVGEDTTMITTGEAAGVRQDTEMTTEVDEEVVEEADGAMLDLESQAL